MAQLARLLGIINNLTVNNAVGLRARSKSWAHADRSASCRVRTLYCSCNANARFFFPKATVHAAAAAACWGISPLFFQLLLLHLVILQDFGRATASARNSVALVADVVTDEGVP